MNPTVMTMLAETQHAEVLRHVATRRHAATAARRTGNGRIRRGARAAAALRERLVGPADGAADLCCA